MPTWVSMADDSRKISLNDVGQKKPIQHHLFPQLMSIKTNIVDISKKFP